MGEPPVKGQRSPARTAIAVVSLIFILVMPLIVSVEVIHSSLSYGKVSTALSIDSLDKSHNIGLYILYSIATNPGVSDSTRGHARWQLQVMARNLFREIVEIQSGAIPSHPFVDTSRSDRLKSWLLRRAGGIREDDARLMISCYQQWFCEIGVQKPGSPNRIKAWHKSTFGFAIDKETGENYQRFLREPSHPPDSEWISAVNEARKIALTAIVPKRAPLIRALRIR